MEDFEQRQADKQHNLRQMDYKCSTVKRYPGIIWIYMGNIRNWLSVGKNAKDTKNNL